MVQRQNSPQRRSIIAGASAALAIVVLAGGAFALGRGIASAPADAPGVAASSSPSAAPTAATATPTSTTRPSGPDAVAPVRTCSVAELAADPRLGEFQARVVDATSGAVLFDRGGSTPSRPASVMKVLTSAAALQVLGPDRRIETRVVRGSEPGSIVLVGGGDLTLSSLPTGEESVYAGAAHLDDLADQVIDAWESNPETAGTYINELVLDSSLFGGETWQPTWERTEQTEGYMPEITALQIDGDRADPTASTSERSTDPVARAGTAFDEALGGGLAIREGTAPAGAEVLGSVQSAPVSTLVQQSLLVSDNAVAEMLARLTAIEAGTGNTFAAEQAAVLQGLAAFGIDTSGITVVDGSGLSDDNAVPPAYLTELFRRIQNREGVLASIYDGLPVSGETGSLAYSDRFTGDAAEADGAVHAKTGWIDTGYTLSGIIDAADGSTLTFAIYALGDVDDTAKRAIDAWTAGVYRCGTLLSDS